MSFSCANVCQGVFEIKWVTLSLGTATSLRKAWSVRPRGKVGLPIIGNRGDGVGGDGVLENLLANCPGCSNSRVVFKG